MTENSANIEQRQTGIHNLARYRPALRELGVVVCSALFFPMFITLVIWELRDGFDTSTLRGAICRSGYFLLPWVFLTLALRSSLRRKGLVDRFYSWSENLRRGLDRCIAVFLFAVLPLKFFYIALTSFEQGKWADSLGRLFFMASTIAVAVALWLATRELKRWQELQVAKVGRFSRRLSYWTVAIATLVPISICGMSIAGYQYGAEQLGWRLVASVLITVLVAVITGFVSHLLLVTQFKVKLRRLTASQDGQTVDTDSINIQEISSQVNRLLSVTALVVMTVITWTIWGQVFPANSVLDQVQLWQGPLNDSGEITFVTLRHILTGLGVIALTFVLSRNLPGILEITLLDRLPLDRGGRYAISFVCRYLVGIIGILFAFQMLGFNWKSLQWLAAGLTVGLGFGLQEIFANIISGIIILIERPVRVGDYVTVNGTSGTVIRMQLRATTIQDLDHRELIVPNKKFITEDVMNWTLTDQRSRAVFQVGIAYGSDTDLVERELLKIARSHKYVLPDPEPVVVFSQFGDSTLNFELRVHIPNRDVYPRVQHEINMEIDRVFREKDIEIAFPQQDIHIRTDPGHIDGKPLFPGLSNSTTANVEVDSNQVS